MILAIDFDGVIHDYKNPIEHRRMGGVIEGAIEAIKHFKIQGCVVIIFCVWAKDEKSIKTIADWCTYWQVPYDDITNIKPQADYYIDDKAIRFTSWQEVLPLIKQV